MRKDSKRWMKRVIALFAITLLFVIVALVYANWKIPHNANKYIYNNTDSIPSRKTALVLGAAKNLGNGKPNPYFVKRIKAAKELYDAGKVNTFVLSGDNGRSNYNEPQDMKDELVSLGVPDSIIYLDYAGFRTLDSVVRMKEIFGENSFIIVSQQFHNERAVFIAQHYGLTAYGYNAQDVTLGKYAYKTIVREKFARVKVFADIITDKQPKFLGEPVKIE